MQRTNRLISKLLRPTESNSVAQLECDFGEYPPEPLTGVCDFPPFSVVRTNPALRSLALLFQMNRAFSCSLSEIERAQSSASHESSAMLDGIRACRAAVGGLDIAYNKLPQVQRILLLLVVAPASPLLVLILVAGFLFSARGIGKSQACYLPLSRCIAVFPEKSASPEHIEALISHEHLHFLQDLNSHTGPPRRNSIFQPERFLTPRACSAGFIHYLLKPNEVEARLHEVVLSYYRSFRELPLTHDAFLFMLLRCRSICREVANVAELCWENYDKTTLPSFDVRTQQIGAELSICLLAFEELYDCYKFISQALPVMYANLLCYYGDNVASVNFMRQIPDPSFYLELYGAADDAASPS